MGGIFSRIFGGKQKDKSASVASPCRTRLLVTDENDAVLANAPAAGPGDYRLYVELVSGVVLIDLSRHYKAFAAAGGKADYLGGDFACNTYVKFGECIQEKRRLFIQIGMAAST